MFSPTNVHLRDQNVRRAVDQALPDVDVLGLLGLLNELVTELNHFVRLSDFLDMVAETAASIIGYDGAIVLVRDQPNELRAWGSFGMSRQYVDAVANGNNWDEIENFTPVRIAWQTGRASVVSDVEDEPRLTYWLPRARREGIRAFASFPLRAQRTTLGVLSVYKSAVHRFTTVDTRLVTAVADVAAAAVEAATLREDQEHRLLELQELSRHRAVADEVHSTLTDIVLSGQGFEAITEMLKKFLGAAVLLEDAQGRLLAASAQNHERADIRLLVECARRAALKRSSEQTQCDARLVAFGSASSRFYEAPVVADGQTLARIWASVDNDLDDRLARLALEYGGMAVALAMLGRRVEQQSRQRDDEELFAALLAANSPADESVVVERGARLGYDLRGPQFMVMVKTERQSSASSGSYELALRLKARLGAVPTALVAPNGSSACVLIPIHEDDGLDESMLLDCLRNTVHDASDNSHGPILVFGRCVSLRSVVNNARITETILGTVATPGGSDSIIDARDLGVYRLLLQVSDPEQLIEVRDETIGLLVEYDEAHRSPLVATLESYLRNSLNARLTAKELTIHINTLTYRLRRVEEILDIELKSPVNLMNIQFGLHVQDILKSTGQC